MGILIDGNTPVIVQGITGKESVYWTKRMLEVGTNIVAGVTPGKGGEEVYGIAVYDTVYEAVRERGGEASVCYVPPSFAKEAAFEALDAGLKLISLVADGVPVYDMLEVKRVAKEYEAVVIGPNSPGLATIGEAMLGFIPVWLEDVYKRGRIGLISRSGTLTNEIASQVVACGLGLSTVVGCGGDPVPGTRFADLLPLFDRDPETDAVVIVGEVGGSMEEEAAEYIRAGLFHKSVIAYVAGLSAPPEKRMGHAGAIITKGRGGAREKQEALKSAGVKVANVPSEVGRLLM